MEANTSRLTLRKSFFDDLWPLILHENHCDTHSKNTCAFFEPQQRRFDNVWAHEFLARKGYGNYEEPVSFSCHHDEAAGTAAQHVQLPARRSTSATKHLIVPLHRQIGALQDAKQQRQRLTHAYVHRRWPWYMQRPRFASGSSSIIDDDDNDNDDQTALHKMEPIELNVLLQLHNFNCPLLIVDMAATVRLRVVERWLKFCRHVQLLVVTRSETAQRQLQLYASATVHTQLLDEDLENSWQEELMRALYTAVKSARELRLLEHCAQPFIFVFSSMRGACTCDSFKVLRKF